MDRRTLDTRAIWAVGEEPYDLEKPHVESSFDNSGDSDLPLVYKPVRKPRTPRLTKKDEEPEMTTTMTASLPVISAERDYYGTPVQMEDEEYFVPVESGPSNVDKALRKVALIILAAMAVVFLVSMAVSLVINDPMILIPFSICLLAGFTYARMEWQVKRKFRKKSRR